MTNLPFLTGSRCYGAPRPGSDLDLVLFVPPHSALLFALEAKGAEQDVNIEASSFPLRFGGLNLIVCATQEAYDAWLAGTEKLAREAFSSASPVSRERAIEVFRPLLQGLGGYQ